MSFPRTNDACRAVTKRNSLRHAAASCGDVGGNARASLPCVFRPPRDAAGLPGVATCSSGMPLAAAAQVHEASMRPRGRHRAQGAQALSALMSGSDPGRMLWCVCRFATWYSACNSCLYAVSRCGGKNRAVAAQRLPPRGLLSFTTEGRSVLAHFRRASVLQLSRAPHSTIGEIVHSYNVPRTPLAHGLLGAHPITIRGINVSAGKLAWPGGV